MTTVAKIINVIEVRDDANVLYFTIEGLQIGGFVEGSRAVPAQQPEPKKAGGVVKPISPQEDKAESDRKSERTFDQILRRKK